jgi:hypothetical protein
MGTGKQMASSFGTCEENARREYGDQDNYAVASPAVLRKLLDQIFVCAWARTVFAYILMWCISTSKTNISFKTPDAGHRDWVLWQLLRWLVVAGVNGAISVWATIGNLVASRFNYFEFHLRVNCSWVLLNSWLWAFELVRKMNDVNLVIETLTPLAVQQS